MSNFTSISIIIVIAIFLLFIFYVGISVYFTRKKDRKILKNSPYCNVKHVVNTEYELPKEGNVYGDVCKVVEPYTIYYVWCEGDEWRKLN